MAGPRLLRYVRIALTAICLTACVLLVALWVRSYWRGDRLYLFYKWSVTLQSFRGSQHFAVYARPWSNIKHSKTQPDPRRIWHWKLTSRPMPNGDFAEPGFDWLGDDDGFELFAPHWCSVVVFAAIAAAPWIRWSRRFSLRTLLIVTTLVAVGLGMVVYLSG
jgi:hypothetical protein